MAINVKFSRPWRYDQGGDGNTFRHIPSDWVGDLEDGVAAAAIVDGAADATGELTEDQQKLIMDFDKLQKKKKAEADEQREIAARIRADAAAMATKSDEELLNIARSEGVIDTPAPDDQQPPPAES